MEQESHKGWVCVRFGVGLELLRGRVFILVIIIRAIEEDTSLKAIDFRSSSRAR
jgi:hypothetical protein